MEDGALTLSREYKLASETYRTVDRAKFYENFLNEKIRPDGRGLFSYRKCVFKDLLSSKSHSNQSHFNTHHNHNYHFDSKQNLNSVSNLTQNLSETIKNVLISSVYLTMGNSNYQCKLTGDLELEELDELTIKQFSQNYSNVNNNFTVDVIVPKHVVNEVYDSNGPCVNISHIVSNFLENVLNSSEVISKEQLSYDVMCSNLPDQFKDDKVVSFVKQHSLSWNFNMQITCDEYDGNLLDACFLISSYCLSKSKLPFVVLIPESNKLYPSLLDNSTLASLDCLEFNKYFLYLQCKLMTPDPVKFENVQELTNHFVQNNLTRQISMTLVPYTVTFCNYNNYFLIDPTREDEQLGINYSVYVLKSAQTKQFQNKLKESIQPLNIMGHPGLDDHTLNKLYEVSLKILNTIIGEINYHNEL